MTVAEVGSDIAVGFWLGARVKKKHGVARGCMDATKGLFYAPLLLKLYFVPRGRPYLLAVQRSSTDGFSGELVLSAVSSADPTGINTQSL